MDTLWTAVSLVLSAVTVHPDNAMFVHTGSLSLKRGYNAFVWADLPLHASNLRVILPPTTRAYVVESRIEPYTPTQTEEPADLRFWRRRIDSLEKLIYTYESRLSLLKAQEATLLENKKLGGAEGGTSAPAVEAYVRLLERELPRYSGGDVPALPQHRGRQRLPQPLENRLRESQTALYPAPLRPLSAPLEPPE
jgi:hypothetical protein